MSALAQPPKNTPPSPALGRCTPLPELVPPPPLAVYTPRPWARLRTWPLPALLAWGLAWGHWAGLRWFDVSAGVAFTAALLVGVALSFMHRTGWRRSMVALGFPLSFALSGAGHLPSWLWLLPLALLALAYPMRSWSDAPLFPTRSAALQGLDELVHLSCPADQARILDAGCGLGHGLRALRHVWPQARLEGIEWSRPLYWLCQLRCRWASLSQGDMWAQSWSDYDVVYLFQRPESMPRAVAKARAEMRPGTWLVSMAFEAPGWRPHAKLHVPGQRPVWVYAVRRSQP